jgi:ABC-2 type transport system permease protein
LKGLLVLIKKELTEQIRTYRLVIVGGVFIFFGLSTPVLLKYLPEILKLVGEQMVIDIPPPTSIQSLAEYADTAGQVGLLMTVLLAMGSIANEIKSGTALMTLVKPVDRGAFVTAKLLALSLNFSICFLVASAVCFAYTYWLIGPTALVPYIGLNLLLVLFLVFCLSVTLLCSSLFNSSLAAGGVSIVVLISQAGLSAVPMIGDYMPGKLLGWGTNLMAHRPEAYWGALAVAIIISAGCIYMAQLILRKRDL